MRIRSIIGAAYAAVAIATATPSAAHGVGEKVTPHFEQTIPNIPGKSLSAVVVDYTPGGASPSHTHAKSMLPPAYSRRPRRSATCRECWVSPVRSAA